MKKTFILFAFAILFLACGNPEKEKVMENGDTVATDTTSSDTTENIAAPADTAGTEPVREVVFDKSDSSTYFDLDNYVADAETKPRADEIQPIDSTCAVLVYPTDEQLEALKNESGDNYSTIAMDNTYYHGMAIEMLDSIDVETAPAKKRYIAFKGSGREVWLLDVRKEGAPPWNLIFFHKTKKPEIVPFTDLSHEKIYEYFEIDED